VQKGISCLVKLFKEQQLLSKAAAVDFTDNINSGRFIQCNCFFFHVTSVFLYQLHLINIIKILYTLHEVIVQSN